MKTLKQVKIGGTAKATVEADVQLARAARSQAQTMIGSVQYNVFSDKPERMGDGLLEIYKPTRLWSAKKKTAPRSSRCCFTILH